MDKETFSKEIHGLIADINVDEILSHIKIENLSSWCNSWRIATKEILNRYLLTNCSNDDNIEAEEEPMTIKFKNGSELSTIKLADNVKRGSIRHYEIPAIETNERCGTDVKVEKQCRGLL